LKSEGARELRSEVGKEGVREGGADEQCAVRQMGALGWQGWEALRQVRHVRHVPELRLGP